jgi:protein-S-isoprenylcysteine O-methyltransferase Ste14
MERSISATGGVNRDHGRSLLQKSVFALGHMSIVAICTWLVYLNGWESLGHAFEKSWQLADSSRAQFLFVCALIYWLRNVLTLFYLLTRRVDWSEVLGILVFIGLIEIGMVLLGGGAFRDYRIHFDILDFLAALLYILGSFLTSFSELQRKWWKKDPANKGHCYTKGLFEYSMHINYFGETMTFTGWSLFTHDFWVLALPLLMAGTFIFLHIPALDSYLASCYGEEFRSYSEKTKKYIPFIY